MDDEWMRMYGWIDRCMDGKMDGWLDHMDGWSGYMLG
jgi:hypothetical protein